MHRLWMFLLTFISCLSTVSFATQLPYHATGTHHVITSKSSGNSSRVLDLSSLITKNLALAVKNPDTGIISYTYDGVFIKKGDYFYQNKNRLQGFPIPTDLTSNDCKLTDVKTPDEVMPAKPTSMFTTNHLNLNASASTSVTPFNPTNSASFNYEIQTTLIDSLNNRHVLSLYFIKDSMNTWGINVYLDNIATGSGQAAFTPDGMLMSTSGLSGLTFIPVSGTAPQKFDIHMAGTTQFASDFTSYPMSDDGFSSGEAVEETVDENGYIVENYTNGYQAIFSKIAVYPG